MLKDKGVTILESGRYFGSGHLEQYRKVFKKKKNHSIIVEKNIEASRKKDIKLYVHSTFYVFIA